MRQGVLRARQAYANKDELDSAFADLNEAIRITPAYARPHTCLGMLYAGKADLQKALTECTKATTRCERLICRYGSWVRPQHAAARATWRLRIIPKPFGLIPRMRGHTSIAGVYAKKGEYDAVIADCTAPIRLNSKEDEAYGTRGWARWHKEEFDLAIADYSEAIRLNRAT